MDIRIETWDELREDRLLPAQAFHFTSPSTAPVPENPDDTLRWAAYEDGRIASRMGAIPYSMRFDGHIVPMTGIGGVATLPEYRGRGHVRALMEKMQAHAREQGHVFSCLFPFNHAFYQKFGYETACPRVTYRFAPEQLAAFRHEGWAKLYHPGDDVGMLVDLFNRCWTDYNLTCVRDGEMMLKSVGHDPETAFRFTYLLGDEEGPGAYVSYKDREEDGKRVLAAEDVAFDGIRGFRMLLGFLSRFSADFGEIALRLPGDLDIPALCRDPYGVKIESNPGYMLRVLNPEKALSLMQKPDFSPFVLEVRDGFLPGWSGRWRVSGSGASATTDTPDAACSARALAVLLTGIADPFLPEARGMLEITGRREDVLRAFPKKKNWFTESY